MTDIERLDPFGPIQITKERDELDVRMPLTDALEKLIKTEGISENFKGELLMAWAKLLSRLEKVTGIVDRQQQQVRILHDDMAKVIATMHDFGRDQAVSHQDVANIARYLTEHAKKLKALERPEG